MRSKMPACSGQADPCRRQARLCEAKCPLAAGRQTPAGDRRGFAKQNARMQRAGRPLPEAGAALRSKMPACSGQADPCRRQARLCEAKCPHAAGKQTPAGGRRGFAKQNARLRRAGGRRFSWLWHAGHPVRRHKAALPRNFGCGRRQSHPWPPFALPWGLAACCAEAVRENASAFSPGCGIGPQPERTAGKGPQRTVRPPCGNAKNAPAAHAGAAGAEGWNTGGTVPYFIPLAAVC